MELYLIQHGLARPKDEDPEEGLSQAGQAQIETAGRALKRLGVGLDLILASPKARSGQTAEVIARCLDLAEEMILQTDQVKAKTPPQKTAAFLGGLGHRKAVLIAGHLPNLAEVASYLLTPAGKVAVAIENGAVMRIDLAQPGPGAGELRWYLRREHLERLSQERSD